MYETVIGLEVHVQLKTASKLFCGCSTEFGAAPNSQTCPVCMGLPGALPMLNEQAMRLAIKTALALNCRVAAFTKFDRKHYFYPDLPKNFQISQYDLPLAEDGVVEIEVEGRKKPVRIKRAHLEEDAGKLIHEKDKSLVDLNRTGMPLLEIVTQPDISSAEEAYGYLTILKMIIEYLGVSDCDMEKGSLRCDANISLRPKGETKLGVKTELKNMNSFKGVKAALQFEEKRQAEVLSGGGRIQQETRLWDEAKGATFTMRSKEEAHDYRYFPEPDLVPFTFSEAYIREIKDSLPELPALRKKRFQEVCGLGEYDAGVLVADQALADYFEKCLKLYNQPEGSGLPSDGQSHQPEGSGLPSDKPAGNGAASDSRSHRQSHQPKAIVNWLTSDVLSQINIRNTNIGGLNLLPEHLIGMIKLIDQGVISGKMAKDILPLMIETGKSAETIAKEKGLSQISDEGELAGIAEGVIAANKKTVDDFLKGNENAVMFLVGQVMKQTKGRANPALVNKVLREKLKNTRDAGAA